jgi:hypothetical protein
VNDVVTKDGLFTLSGSYLKIAGDGNKVGVFFVMPGTPTVAIKVMSKLAANDPSKIVGKGMRAPARQGLVCRSSHVLLRRREPAQRAARDTEQVHGAAGLGGWVNWLAGATGC